MWWDEATRTYRKHPDCTCDQTPCVCRWLRPLNQFGVPMPCPVIDALREHHGDPLCGCKGCREREFREAERVADPDPQEVR